jgi:hypothetical protein
MKEVEKETETAIPVGCPTKVKHLLAALLFPLNRSIVFCLTVFRPSKSFYCLSQTHVASK